MLTRVFVNIKDRKLLTAEKILDNIEALFTHIRVGKTLQIVTDPSIRRDCKHIDLDILVKKFYLQKGILSTGFNKDLEAQDYFLYGMTYGTKFDPRLRLESIF
jgi:hypothetical protein